MKKLITLLLLPLAGFGFILANGCHPVVLGKKNVVMGFTYSHPVVTSKDVTDSRQDMMHPLIMPAFIKY